jgi:hypothetical protein
VFVTNVVRPDAKEIDMSTEALAPPRIEVPKLAAVANPLRWFVLAVVLAANMMD